MQNKLTSKENKNDPQSLFNFLLRFIEYSTIHNLSARTIETKTVCINKFILWCDDRGLSRPTEINKQILERYQRHLFLLRKANGKPLGIHSQYIYLSNVKTYFKWLAQNNHILYNPAHDLEMPKLNRSLPKNILSASQVETVINQADTNTALGIRDRAIMEVFYSTGIRRKELIDLQIQDLDASRGVLMINLGKGNKDRLIPIGKRAIAWVEKYLYAVRDEYVISTSGQYLFLNAHGEALGLSWLSQIIRDYIKQADIGKQGSCHLFRHTMATLMLENGADIRYIQAMLGHADLRTTQVYTKVSIAKLKEIHTITHPAKHKPREKPKHQESQESQEPPNEPETKTLH